MIAYVVLALLAGVAGFAAGRLTADRWPDLSPRERFARPAEARDEDSIESAELTERVQSWTGQAGYAEPAEPRP